MSVSLPSKEGIIVDVPEVRRFRAQFVYNFHVPDELVSDNATNIPRSILSKPSEFFDSDYIDFVKTRIPRHVRFDFSPVFMQNPTLELTDEQRREISANRRISQGNLLRKFYDKIIGEQEFASDAFNVVNFTDQGIEKKLYDFVSGSLENIMADADITVSAKGKKKEDYQKALEKKRVKDKNEVKTLMKKVRHANSLTSKAIGFDFLARSVSQPQQDGVYFLENDGKKLTGRDITLNGLKNVSLKSQINSKVFNTIVKSAYFNPFHTISSEMNKLASTSEVKQKEARAKYTQISQTDYMTLVDPIDVCAAPTITVTSAQKRIVGYVIDKWEMLPNGDLAAMEPILLENPYVANAVDYKVKYGSRYAYQVRTVAEYTMPAITQEDHQLVVIKLLISSKPTRKIFVDCVEKVPPPFPTDVDFVWDYERNNLIITWTFPPNSQRDIKKFQVFRRKSIKEPFQLLKVYDFDDTLRGDPYVDVNPENISSDMIEHMFSPKLTYIDYDFKKDSKFIYAICAMDAHGFTSNYSVQMESSFDRFANRLNKRMICISDCPKPYPNMNLAQDTFADVMYHENGSRMKVYFTPEYLGVYNNEGQTIPIMSTNQLDAEYKIKVINIDAQKEQTVDVQIEDRRRYDKAKDDLFVGSGLKSIDPNRFKP